MTKITYSGIGSIFMAPINADGTLQTGKGFVPAGDAHPFSIQISTETKKHTSREVDRAGQTLATKTSITDSIGSLVLHQWDAANLAYALAGGKAAEAVSASSVASEAITAVHDEYVRLTKPKVSAVVVKDVTDTTTYVADTDYEVQANLGMIKVLSTGAIADAAVIHVSFDYAAQSKYQVNIGTTALIRVAIIADLADEYTGESLSLELYSVVLNSSQEINFISEADSDHESLAFTLSLETPGSQTSPGKVNGVPM